MSLIGILVNLLIVGLILWAIVAVVDILGVPEPFRKAIRLIVFVIAIIILIYALISLVPLGAYDFRIDRAD